jgi:hypothetical protein
VVRDPSDLNSPACKRSSFGIANAKNPAIRYLTTPTAYITSYPPDPFADTRGLIFGYSNARNAGWILWSYGPDCDEKTGGQIGQAAGITPQSNSGGDGTFKVDEADKANFGWEDQTEWYHWPGEAYVYFPGKTNPSAYLLTGGFTYDSTNGSKSQGDIYRVKQ